jgi:carbamoyl-phosphate synthase large subunit
VVVMHLPFSPDENEDIVAIEINPRVSFLPLGVKQPVINCKIASKLALGYNLDELQNQITKSTSALFRPNFRYVIVEIKCWN